MRAPHNNDKKKLVDANLRALSTSCAPSLRLILLPAPCPNMKPKALIIAIRANTTPVAPLTLVPSWLTKKVSAILYTLVTSITHCGWQSKLQYQFVDGGFCHFIILYLRTICFHNMYTFIYKCGK